MKQRRRLSDLYVRGKELAIDDGTDDPVRVWLQKLNGIDRESCIRRAHAQKARFMIEADDEGSELFQSTYAQLRTMDDRKTLVSIIVSEELGRFRQRIEAELAGDEDGWGKDGYLQGLVDAWIGDDDNPGLAATRTEDPDDPEVKRVQDELDRFEKEVIERTKTENDRLNKDWEAAEDDVVLRRATRQVLESRSIDVFGRELERQQLFYSVRDPEEHAKRYFGTVAELDDLHDEVRKQLADAYNELLVDPIEGKDSRASQPSLNSSGPSLAEEAHTDSGLQAVSA